MVDESEISQRLFKAHIKYYFPITLIEPQDSQSRRSEEMLKPARGIKSIFRRFSLHQEVDSDELRYSLV